MTTPAYTATPSKDNWCIENTLKPNQIGHIKAIDEYKSLLTDQFIKESRYNLDLTLGELTKNIVLQDDQLEKYNQILQSLIENQGLINYSSITLLWSVDNEIVLSNSNTIQSTNIIIDEEGGVFLVAIDTDKKLYNVRSILTDYKKNYKSFINDFLYGIDRAEPSYWRSL